MTARHIVNFFALLGHDAEHHDPNTTMMASKQAGKPDLIYSNNIIEAHIKITSIIIKINFYISTREGGGTRALLLLAMSFDGHFGQPVPIATHPPIGQVMLHRPMCGDWHGLTKKSAKTDLVGRVFCAVVGAAAACFVGVLWLLHTGNTQTQ